jgi:hypothetical protein
MGIKDAVIEIVGDNQTFFRQITDLDLLDIARTYIVDRNIQAAHDAVWKLSEPFAIDRTGNVEFTVIDDSNDKESCGESWVEIHEQLKVGS